MKATSRAAEPNKKCEFQVFLGRIIELHGDLDWGRWARQERGSGPASEQSTAVHADLLHAGTLIRRARIEGGSFQLFQHIPRSDIINSGKPVPKCLPCILVGLLEHGFAYRAQL
jgi:hypothetical protein